MTASGITPSRSPIRVPVQANDGEMFSPRPFPTESGFSSPMLWSAVLVLIPGLLISGFLGDGDLPRFWQLLVGNWISPFIVWFFAGSFLFLIKKRSLLRRERAFSQVLENQCLTSLEDGSAGSDAKAWLEQQIQAGHSLNREQASVNLLVERLQNLSQSEEHKARGESQHQAELDRLDQSFAMIRFMIWAIPILGFIGTVWGISGAVGHFSEAMNSVESASGMSQALRDNLPLVTRNLGTAFDTTFLALVLSLPLMWMLTALQKQEESYLVTLNEHWHRDWLPKLPGIQGQASFVNVQTSEMALASATVPAKGSQPEAIAPELASLSEQVRALGKAVDDYAQVMLLGQSAKEQSTEKPEA